MDTRTLLANLIATMQWAAFYFSSTIFWFYYCTKNIVYGEDPAKSPHHFASLFQAISPREPINRWDTGNSSFERLASYKISNEVILTVAVGNIAKFSSPRGAIVTPCNEWLNTFTIGADRNVISAGGYRLMCARRRLPILEGMDDGHTQLDMMAVRCRCGEARLVGPGWYGDLKVPYIIHAVGPDYRGLHDASEIYEVSLILRDSYQNALRSTAGTEINQVAVSPLCNDGLRGGQNISKVLDIAVDEIFEFTRFYMDEDSKLKDIVLVANCHGEAHELLKRCDARFTGQWKVHKVN